MGTSTFKAVGAAVAAPGDAGRARRARLWRSLRAAGAGAQHAAPVQLVEELEREVALLREETARLRVAGERAGERPVNERVRAALPSLAPQDAPDGDEPWELLTECMLLRDGLVDACGELERGARELRRRLESILPGAEGARTEALVSDELEDLT
jgi:hypothetical protein